MSHFDREVYLDLIREADGDLIEFRAGTFFRDGLEVPDGLVNHYRGLVLAGLLELDNQLVQPTREGRDAIRGAAR